MFFRALVALALSGLACLTPQLARQPALPELLAALALLSWRLDRQRGLIVVAPAGLLLLTAAHWSSAVPTSLRTAPAIVTGVICEFPGVRDGEVRFLLRRIDPDGGPRQIRVSWYRTTMAPQAGETWQLKLVMRPPLGSVNRAGFDYERWAFSRGIEAGGIVRESPVNRRVAQRSFACPLMRLRGQLLAALDHAMGEVAGRRFVVGLAIGARHRLTEVDWALLRKTGTAHLMAISGLHIGLVATSGYLAGRAAATVLLMLGLIRSARLAGHVAASLAALTYAVAAGLSVPTVRALIMILAVVTALSIRRRAGRWSVWGLALSLVLIFSPPALLGPGFWLSFGAVGVLLLQGATFGVSRTAGSIFDRGVVLWRLQVALLLGMTPLTLIAFGGVPLLAPVINLVAVPLVSLLVVPLVLIGTIFALAGVDAGGLCLRLAARGLDRAANMLDHLLQSIDLTWTPSIVPAAMGLVALGALLAAWPRPLPGRSLGAVLGLMAVTLTAGSSLARGEFRVSVHDVGQGLSVLVTTRRHALLYDAGPSYRHGDAGARIVLPAIATAGIRKLDALIVSHEDVDHRGGAAAVHARFPQATVRTNFASVLSATRSGSCDTSARWIWDDVEFRVLHPSADARVLSDNDRSCVLSVRSASGSILLPGDIERAGEVAVVREISAPFDVVVAPHHGSRTSSGRRLIRATDPDYVVFSAAPGNRWNFPHAEVMARWARGGACLLNTATDGAIAFHTAGGRLRVRERARIDRRRLWRLRWAEAVACQGRENL